MVVAPAVEQRDIAIFSPAERRKTAAERIEDILARFTGARPDKADMRDLAGRKRRSAQHHCRGAKQQHLPAADATVPRNPLCSNRHRGLPGRFISNFSLRTA